MMQVLLTRDEGWIVEFSSGKTIEIKDNLETELNESADVQAMGHLVR
jgi:hypothetical protein